MTSPPARIWEETVTIPTYPAPPPDPNPMFFENRANQGASGRVYPNPFTDRVNHERKIDQPYQAVFLENEYIQLMVLPRFGGRIHAALSLRALGQQMEANEKLQALWDFAQKKLEVEDEGGFFTSKPAMIDFDDDPKVLNQIQGHYLLGLAQLGLGNDHEAEESFKSVLSLDPHHWWAQFQLANR